MKRIEMGKTAVRENNRVAAELREAFTPTGALALNFVGSSGSGKTMLLEKTLELLPAHTRAAVLTNSNDTQRLLRYGYPVREIQTPGGVLQASMVEELLGAWLIGALQLLLIENTGGVASYDLGEDAAVVVVSVTESEYLPLRHREIFRRAEVLILNKIDLLPYVPFRLERACANARSTNPEIEIIETSCATGAGLGQWMRWLEARAARKVEARAAKKVAALLSAATA
jgi:hydrogenase nickel incorporation protein HypB